MNRVLVLFAHPSLQTSRVHRRMVPRARDVEGVTFHDLYERYPDYDVDVEAEQQLLSGHDVVVWQHPLYWYSVPPLLKQWMDLVLEHGWAYGSTGHALQGKALVEAVSTGGPESAYSAAGANRFTIPEFLRPQERTAKLCGMEWLPPWVVFGSHRMGEDDLEAAAARYRELLQWLVDGGHRELPVTAPDLLNALFPVPATPGNASGASR